jgi:hypothetical protein
MHAIGRISDPKLVLAVLCASLACSTTDHTPEPYRSDPVAGAELSARAADFCTSAKLFGQEMAFAKRRFPVST